MATPDAATMRRLRQQGKAMPPKEPGGSPRFPIRNADDLANAIRAVGRVRPNTEEARSKVRRYIISRARALGLSSKIPDSWASDGTLKDGGDASSSGSSQSGSNSPAAAGNPGTGSSDSDADDTGVAAMTARLARKGMSPAAARIFATRAAKRRKAAA